MLIGRKGNKDDDLDALESPRERYVCVVVHPIGAEVKHVCGLRDTPTESLLGIRETQCSILLYERAVDVVDVLCAVAVLERRVQDHHSTTVHDEAYLPPERAVQTLREVREHPLEERSCERGVIYGFQSRNCNCRYGGW